MLLNEVREHLRTYIANAGNGPKEKALLTGTLQHVEQHLAAMEVLHEHGHDETVFIVSRAVVESITNIGYLLETDQFPAYVQHMRVSGMKHEGQDLKRAILQWFGIENEMEKPWPDLRSRLSQGTSPGEPLDVMYDLVYRFSSEMLHGGAMHIAFDHLQPDFRFDYGVVRLAAPTGPWHENLYEALTWILAGWTALILQKMIETWGGPMQRETISALERCKEDALLNLQRLSAEAL